LGSLHELRLRHARHFDVSVQLLSSSQHRAHGVAPALPASSSASKAKADAEPVRPSPLDWLDAMLRERFPLVTRVSASGEELSMSQNNGMQLHMRYRLPKAKSTSAVAADDGKVAADSGAGSGSANGDWRLSEVFSALESARAECGGAFEYSVTDLSLEQLFIAFAQQRQRHDQH